MQGNNMNYTFTKEHYDRIMDPEKLTTGWVLLSSPLPVFFCLVSYLAFVLKLGPEFMKDRKPFKLKTIMRIYNLTQVLLNGFIIYKTNEGNHWSCVFDSFCVFEDGVRHCERSRVPFLYSFWIYMFLKVLDLLDTVFLVLRKKDSHVSFLHVYHHVSMVIFIWVSAHYYKTPQAGFIAFVNVVVHTVMYAYYFLATFSAMKRFLWWKSHLTKLQLSQFAVIISYLIYLYYHQCEISPVFTYIWLFNVTIICSLFVNFYIKAYLVNNTS